MHNAVSNPRTTLDIIRRNSRVGLEDHQGLLVGQITVNAAADITNGMFVEVPKAEKDINELFGSDSHLALLARSYRELNEYTNLYAIALDDDGGATKATASITFSGAATANKTLSVTVVSEHHYTFDLEIETGDVPADVLDKLEAVITARGAAPFSFAQADSTGTFTANNGGSIANNWPIKVKGRVPGLTYTLVGWTGGATDPDLTTLFDEVQDVRFQGIAWPESYPTSNIKNFIDPRKNVDNDVMDGMAFISPVDTFVNLKTKALALNSSEICLLTNEVIDEPDWKGICVPTAPDMIATYTAAVRALRIEDGVSISDYVTSTAPRNQFGGSHMHSTPFFNTPIRFIGRQRERSGFTSAEQLELENSGVSVLGGNITNTVTVLGQLVTTWQKDPAGNDDETWKYVNWRDTHGAIREYFVLNNRKRWAQSKMSIGAPVPGHDMATKENVRAFQVELYGDTGDQTLTVLGPESRRFFENNLEVLLIPEQRQIVINERVLMISQVGNTIGTIQYAFNTA